MYAYSDVARCWSAPYHTTCFLVPLPSQDEAPDAETEARVRAQSLEIRAQIKAGVRPGVVVPRLKCLESQEAAQMA